MKSLSDYNTLQQINFIYLKISYIFLWTFLDDWLRMSLIYSHICMTKVLSLCFSMLFFLAFQFLCLFSLSLVLGKRLPRVYPLIFPLFILKAKIVFWHFHFLACLPGFYGLNCAHVCDCKNGASCDAASGQCICPAGFHGNQCEKGRARVFLSIECGNSVRLWDLSIWWETCKPESQTWNNHLSFWYGH